jgi:hypothetical protein
MSGCTYYWLYSFVVYSIAHKNLDILAGLPRLRSIFGLASAWGAVAAPPGATETGEAGRAEALAVILNPRPSQEANFRCEGPARSSQRRGGTREKPVPVSAGKTLLFQVLGEVIGDLTEGFTHLWDSIVTTILRVRLTFVDLKKGIDAQVA